MAPASASLKAALGLLIWGLASGCFISPDERLWKGKLDLDDGAAATDAPPPDAPPPDAPPTEARADLASEAMPVKCDDKYGAAPGYVLCSETGATCRFNAKTGGGTCKQICTSLGGTCLWAEDNNTEPCVPVGTDTCDSLRSTEICTCSK